MAQRFKVGDESKQSGGDPNILKLADQTKIRLVDDSGAGAIAWRQHTIKHKDDDQQVEFVVCPGPKVCPLCRKPVSIVEKEDGKKESVQNFPVSKRFATNVWDYGSSKIKILIAGPQVFDEFASTKAVGIDPASCDWIVHKTGSGIQTKYKMVRANASAFEHTNEVGPETLIDLDKYGADDSPEKIFELLEKAGIDYDAIEAPNFTLEEALEFVLPFGRGKGMTVEQMLAQDPEWCEWLHGTRLEDELFGDPIFLALQTAMEARNMVVPVDQIPEPAPVNDETPVEEAAPAATGPSMVTLLDPDGAEQEVPAEAKDALLSAGYTEKPEPEPEPESEVAEVALEFPVTMCGTDGTEVPAPTQETMEALQSAGFIRKVEEEPEPVAVPGPPYTMRNDAGVEVPAESDEARVALEAVGFTMIGGTATAPAAAAAEPEEPSTPTPTMADEQVAVIIAGTAIQMAFKAALATAKAGTPVEFEDSSVAEYAEFLASTGGEPPEADEAPAQSAAEHAMHTEAQEPKADAESPPADPDKPFQCQVEGCNWSGKTKGSLTQHIKREHGGEAPAGVAPAAAAPASNGGRDEEIRYRVKELLKTQPKKDYKTLLALFEKITGGKRDISKFTTEELLALEKELQD